MSCFASRSATSLMSEAAGARPRPSSAAEHLPDAGGQRPPAIALEEAREQPLPRLLGAGQGATVPGLEPERVHRLDAHRGPGPRELPGGSTTSSLDVSVLGPDFHRNTVPGSTGPSRCTERTSAVPRRPVVDAGQHREDGRGIGIDLQLLFGRGRRRRG